MSAGATPDAFSTLRDEAEAIDAVASADFEALLDATDRVGTAYDSAAPTYEYKTRKQHYLTDEAHAASFEEYLPPVRDAEDLVLREAGAAQRNARAVLGQLVEAMAVTPEEMI